MGADRHRTVRRIRAIQNINPGRDRVEASERGQSGQTTGRAQRPSLERPSLFAGMDDGASHQVSAEGVRILSTLESASKVQGRPRLASRPAGHGARWALWSLVGAGLATAGTALWMAPSPSTLPSPAVQPQPMAQADKLASVAAAKAASPGTAPRPPFASLPPPAAQTASSKPTGTPLAALIENTPPAAGPTVLKVQEAAPQTASARASAASPAQTSMATSTSPKSPPKVSSTATSKAAAPKAKPRKERSAKDRDVELLEAVMSHTERRPAR